ncbi:MAG: kelch repeat-containing protein [Vicingaceae bacterium]
MHKILLFSLSLFSASLMAQSWVQVSNTPSTRHHPISFSLNGKGYAVSGTAPNSNPTNTVFDYDPVSDSWGTLPNFPGAARSFGIGAVTNGIAYLGFGATNTAYLNDLWSFDATDSSWTQLANCSCSGRRHPAMMAIGNRLYVGFGDDASGDLNDFWMYDISSNTWTQIANIPGPVRHHPFMFTVNGSVYAGLGHGGQFIYRDWYRLDTATNQWTSMNLFPGQARVAGTQFSANGYGYVLSGDGSNHSFMNTGEMWRYDPNLDSWTQLTPHPGRSRWAPGSFVINNEVFFFGGLDRLISSYPNNTWKYNLGGSTNTDDHSLSQSSNLLYPNPAQNVIHWDNELGATEVRVFNMKGQLVLSQSAMANQLDVESLSEGLYMVQFFNQSDLLNSNKVMINR